MRKKAALIAVAAAIFTIIPVAVYASHQFNDVPNDHTFHTAIDWLADTGITAGCNPPANDEFCPDDPVNRGQMATFLKRFHDRFVSGGAAIGLGFARRLSSTTPSTGNGVVDDLSLTLKVPAAGVLVVNGSVDMANETAADNFACGINTGGSPSVAAGDSWRRVDLFNSVYDTCTTTTAGTVQPGTYIARIVVASALPTTEAHGGSISATLYTGDGVFGLLDVSEEQVEAPETSDTPKG